MAPVAPISIDASSSHTPVELQHISSSLRVAIISSLAGQVHFAKITCKSTTSFAFSKCPCSTWWCIPLGKFRNSAWWCSVLVASPNPIRDYVYNSIWKSDFVPNAHSTSSDFSGKSRYLLTPFINYKKFSATYRISLAIFTIDIEPIQYSDVVPNPKRRLAMRQEIDALEKKNGT